MCAMLLIWPSVSPMALEFSSAPAVTRLSESIPMKPPSPTSFAA
jgi:hypothetical protein